MLLAGQGFWVIWHECKHGYIYIWDYDTETLYVIIFCFAVICTTATSGFCFVFSCRCGDCQARSLPAPAVWELDLYVHWYLKCVSCHFSILIVGIHAAFKYACAGIHTCYITDWLMIAYIALFSALLSRLSALACGSTWVTSFIARFLNIRRSGVLTALAWLVPHETAAISAQVLCTPYNHAPCHCMQSHICQVYACLAVTCHLHFWQNDRDLLCATAVTRGWNRYRNKSQHRKSTLEKKILLPLQQGFEPATFQSQVRRSNHRAIPAPYYCLEYVAVLMSMNACMSICLHCV